MTSALISPETKGLSFNLYNKHALINVPLTATPDTTPSLTVAVNRLSISSSPFPSPGSPFFPPPILSPHEYAVMSSTTKRRSTDSRMNAGNNIGTNHESAPPSAHPAAPTVTAAGLATGKPSTTESQDRKPAAGDDKMDKGTDHLGRGSDLDVTCLGNGNVNGGVAADPLVPASPAPLLSELVLSPGSTQPPSATVPPNVASNGAVEAVSDVPFSESPPTTPLASNQNTPTTIIQPSSPPSTSSTAPTDPARSSPLDGLRSSRNSLTSSRPAPPSPAASRRASGALSRSSSTRSRPNSTPLFSTSPANPHEPAAEPTADDDSTTSANPGAAPSPTTPTPQLQQQQQQQQAHRASSQAPVKIRDFGFPDDDVRHTGLGPLTPRPNRRLHRPLSAWSASSTSSASSNDDDDDDGGGEDPASSSAGGSSYGFAGWGLGRLSWFGVRSGAGAAADGGGSGGGGGPSQGDFERNFEDAVSPSYEIDDPYDSLDDDDDFDDYEDGGDGHAVGEGRGEEHLNRPLLPGMYRALYAFEPEGTAEMALEEDQIVRVVGRGGGVGWAIVARGGDEGHALVPEGYLELVSLDHEQEQLGEEDG